MPPADPDPDGPPGELEVAPDLGLAPDPGVAPDLDASQELDQPTLSRLTGC